MKVKMMFKNVFYLLLGVILGAILGILVCDETKKKLQKKVLDKARLLSDCCKSSSEEAEHTVKEVANIVKNSVKGYFN